MQLLIDTAETLQVRVDPGEEVLEVLRELSESRHIGGASFFGIGAIEAVTLAWYDVQKKEYTRESFKEQLEIVSLSGNIAWLNEECIVHAHGSFSRKDMSMIAGHVVDTHVSATCEVTLRILPGRLQRAYSEATGLNLLTLP